ncbi:2-oxo-4-hydroxy-4-carboxy-5-ureidoimidazoline decarboxylase [Amycolatopsis pigmentata]|uniref:2-oxo-4-hydroxy-4-carboxy-5-ureidoimidazoline decarboxylase n=1 Tax=Amycolatopsis pigmentata TaxID=450801 RepID=A0ABW5G6H8_9PSEU
MVTDDRAVPLDLAAFNHATPEEVRPVLAACLAVPRWVDAVLAGRPYPDREALFTSARFHLGAQPPDPHWGQAPRPPEKARLTPPEIRRAVAAHPRIGERTTGASAAEQSGVDSAAAERFRVANAEYERRFGHVYLVCASGRDGDELLADLTSRLDHDPETELEVAGRELAKIALLRLAKAVTT